MSSVLLQFAFPARVCGAGLGGNEDAAAASIWQLRHDLVLYGLLPMQVKGCFHIMLGRLQDVLHLPLAELQLTPPAVK